MSLAAVLISLAALVSAQRANDLNLPIPIFSPDLVQDSLKWIGTKIQRCESTVGSLQQYGVVFMVDNPVTISNTGGRAASLLSVKISDLADVPADFQTSSGQTGVWRMSITLDETENPAKLPYEFSEGSTKKLWYHGKVVVLYDSKQEAEQLWQRFINQQQDFEWTFTFSNDIRLTRNYSLRFVEGLGNKDEDCTSYYY